MGETAKAEMQEAKAEDGHTIDKELEEEFAEVVCEPVIRV